MKFLPSTDLWVCEHGYSYPDICPQCKEKKMELPGVTVYVWANTMEKAIIELANGRYYSSRREAINKTDTRPLYLDSAIIWEIIIRRT